MSDSPTTRGLMRKQSIGSNNNTWGDTLLNLILDLLDRWIAGYQTYTVSGNATLSWSNYSVTNDFLTANVKLSGPSGDGTLSAPATIIIPSVEFRNKVYNRTGQSITITTAAGTGVTIPDKGIVDLVGDGSNIYNRSPTHCGTSTQDTATNAYALWGAVQTAIATAGLPATAGTILNSASDTTAGYNSAKNTASGLLKATTVNAGANESLNHTATGYVASGTNAYTIAAGATSKTAFQSSYLVTFPAANTGPVTLNDGSGAVAVTKNGSQPLGANDIPAGATRLLTFDGTQFQIPVVPPPVHLPMLHAMAG